jgi:hypothetical protein
MLSKMVAAMGEEWNITGKLSKADLRLKRLRLDLNMIYNSKG